MAAVDSAPVFTLPKVVEKAFLLPIVSDAYYFGKIVLVIQNLSVHILLTFSSLPLQI